MILDKLIKLKELDLYYYMMNEISVIGFDGVKLEISSDGSNKLYNERLARIIGEMIGGKASVFSSNLSGKNLKSKMIEEIKKSQSWSKISTKFPDAEIEDVIHKDSL
ncbi:MAG: hypothetical protein RLZZ59_834 [Pseudomonadota bacterium]|jgi:DNA polymerase-3 subunit gamma/tau